MVQSTDPNQGVAFLLQFGILQLRPVADPPPGVAAMTSLLGSTPPLVRTVGSPVNYEGSTSHNSQVGHQPFIVGYSG